MLVGSGSRPADQTGEDRSCRDHHQRHDQNEVVGSRAVVDQTGDRGSEGCDQKVHIDQGIVDRIILHAEEQTRKRGIRWGDAAVSQEIGRASCRERV